MNFTLFIYKSDNIFKSIFFFATLFLLLLVGNLYAMNYYVSTASLGNATADSWTNKTIITSLDWTQLHGGDTVYVDGGADSLTYGSVMLEGVGDNNGIIVITNGKDSGHNGKAIFSCLASDSATKGYSFRIKTFSRNIILTGLTFKWLVGTGTYCVSLEQVTNVHIDNCHIISNGKVECIIPGSDTAISITNNIIETLANNYTTEQDGIEFANGGGGHTIIGNTIIVRGINPVVHLDCIQMGGDEGLTNKYQTIIANNFIYNTGTSQGIHIANAGSNRFLIYNNIIIVHDKDASAFTITQASPYHTTAQIYNNTIISKSHYTCDLLNLDTLIFKNNICMIDSSPNNISIIGLGEAGLGLSGLGYKSFDYNQYFQRGNPIRIDTGAYYHTAWAQWKALGYDAHSDTGIVNFANIWGTNATDYKLATGSSGIDGGTTIPLTSPAFDGTIRPQDKAYDRGAFETSVASNESFNRHKLNK